MRFEHAREHVLFAESVRTALAGWEPPREPELGAWLDDRDDALAERLEAVGWIELWSQDELLGAVVAGGLELGRAVAPICIVDEATLGGSLALGGRARHGKGAEAFVVPLPRQGLALAASTSELTPEPTLDGNGTARAEIRVLQELGPSEATTRWQTWSTATLAYIAGLASQALELTLEHARAREQFDAPLSSLPGVQSRLADAALVVDGLELTAWYASTATGTALASPELLWAGGACREVTATAHQIHGAMGFALESGLHRYFRRSKAVQVWTDAVCRACADNRDDSPS